MSAAAAERFDDGWVDFGSGEGIAGGNVCEAHEGTHEGELPRVIELEARNAFARRGDRRFGKYSQLAAIDKGVVRGLAPLRSRSEGDDEHEAWSYGFSFCWCAGHRRLFHRQQMGYSPRELHFLRSGSR